jgi:hypothetical protein
MLTTGLSDIRGLAWNSGTMLALNLAGTGLALAVDRLAHKIFKVEEGSKASLIIKTVSVGSVVALSFYFKPHLYNLEFATFTGRKTLEMLATSVLVSIVVEKLCSAILAHTPKTISDFTENAAKHPLFTPIANAHIPGLALGYSGSKHLFFFQGISGALRVTNLFQHIHNPIKPDDKSNSKSPDPRLPDDTSNSH